MEKCLRQQGFHGNSYRFLSGDNKENSEMVKNALLKPINLSDDAVARAIPFIHHTVEKYGKNSFMWFGPAPRLLVTDPELIKEVMNKNNIFKKIKQNPIVRMFSHGLASIYGDQWAQYKKLLAPAFHLHKLKNIAVSLALALFVEWAWRVLNWVWVKPQKMEKCLRQQGLNGNSYHFLYGDSKESSALVKNALSKPINLSDDAVARASPFIHHTVEKYGNTNIH
ncbi:hypothetical protein AgCh_007699 [Apium graveolens]